MFSVCTIDAGVYHDHACIIKAGEHPFIVADSYVLYAKPMAAHHDGLKKKTDGWVYYEKAPVSADLLVRIVDGADKSRHTPRWAKVSMRNAKG